MLKKIFTPGPTEVPHQVLDSIIKHKTYHRSDEFKHLHNQLAEKLKKIFFTEQYLLVLTSSGTGAMEAAVLNFCSQMDKLFYVNQGRFGERWGEICKEYGMNTTEIKVEPGNSLQIENLKGLDIEKADVFFLTHSETSTATLTDIHELIKHIKNNSNALIIVDGITSIGALEFKMDEWNVDVVVAASQKGLMCPPGLSVIGFNERAKNKMLINPVKRFYFDLRKDLHAKVNDLTTWTPSIGLFHGLDTAADLILNEGIENRWKRVSSMAQYFRNRGIDLGFSLFSKYPADSLTALKMPHNIPSKILINRLFEKHGIVVANGQEELKDKIFRVSHMGDLKLEDFESLCDIIQIEMSEIQN
ncbi:MAG: pyridoxal-phosphate-dependent aminotransferase family protein [Ignavibacteria bacterium]